MAAAGVLAAASGAIGMADGGPDGFTREASTWMCVLCGNFEVAPSDAEGLCGHFQQKVRGCGKCPPMAASSAASSGAASQAQPLAGAQPLRAPQEDSAAGAASGALLARFSGAGFWRGFSIVPGWHPPPPSKAPPPGASYVVGNPQSPMWKQPPQLPFPSYDFGNPHEPMWKQPPQLVLAKDAAALGHRHGAPPRLGAGPDFAMGHRPALAVPTVRRLQPQLAARPWGETYGDGPLAQQLLTAAAAAGPPTEGERGRKRQREDADADGDDRDVMSD